MIKKEIAMWLAGQRIKYNKFIERSYISGIDDMSAEYDKNASLERMDFEDLLSKMIQKLEADKVYFRRCSPKKANCAIRVYRADIDIEGKKGFVCGAMCFVKMPFKNRWITQGPEDSVIEMTFDPTMKVDYWTSHITCYNEQLDAKYFDVYLKYIPERNI